jgi:hypothetical protein
MIGETLIRFVVGGLVVSAFAVVWFLAPRLPGWLTLALAALAWTAISIGAWAAFELIRRRRKPAPRLRGARSVW